MGRTTSEGNSLPKTEVLAIHIEVSQAADPCTCRPELVYLGSFCIGTAVLSVAAAIFILDVTIFQLNGSSDAAPTSDGGDDLTPQLAAHSSAGILFAFLGLSFVVIISALGLYIGGNGLETLKHGLVGKPSTKEENVEDHVCV
jgi:hypothetical protein